MKLPRLEKEIRIELRKTLDVIFEHDRRLSLAFGLFLAHQIGFVGGLLR